MIYNIKRVVFILSLFGRFLPPSSEGPEEGRKDGEVYGTTR